MGEGTVSIADAARLLERSYERTWRLLLSGALDGHRLPNRRWAITRRSLEAFRQRERDEGSQISP